MDYSRGCMSVDPMAEKMAEKWVDWLGEHLDEKMAVKTAVTKEHMMVAPSDYSSVVYWATSMAAW